MTEFAVSLFLVVLAGDLLYLYFKGGWHDPNKIIERSELVCLALFVLGGIANSIRCIREMLR